MRPDDEGHRFNNDLLANPGDTELAETSYPDLIHVLVHPELQMMFTNYDRITNDAKRRSRIAGLFAIVLGTFALFDASIASLLPGSEGSSTFFGLSAAVAGILSVLIGLWGLLYGDAKRRWLSGRLMTERLRQFHFQTFVCHLPDIASSLVNPQDALHYQEARKRWFAVFKGRFENHLSAELTAILEKRTGSDVWVHDCTPPDSITLDADLRQVFGAYRELRMTHQIQYANYKLRTGGGLLSPSPREVQWVLSQGALLCILLLFVIHAGIAIGLTVSSLDHGNFITNPRVHVAIIVCAILALAIRALEDGLGIRAENERYRDYRATVEALRERFDQARDAAMKVQIMEEMERRTYEEMSSFLRDGSETRFVM